MSGITNVLLLDVGLFFCIPINTLELGSGMQLSNLILWGFVFLVFLGRSGEVLSLEWNILHYYKTFLSTLFSVWRPVRFSSSWWEQFLFLVLWECWALFPLILLDGNFYQPWVVSLHVCINQCCVQHLRGPSAHSVVQLSLFWSLGLWTLAIFVSLHSNGEFLLLNLGNLWCSPTVPLPYKMVWKLKALSWGDGKTHTICFPPLRDHFFFCYLIYSVLKVIFHVFFSFIFLVISGRKANSLLLILTRNKC